MTDNNQGKGVVKGAKNIVYSGIVFFVVAAISLAVLDPNALNNHDGPRNIGPGSFIAIGLSGASTIIFSMWLSKRGK